LADVKPESCSWFHACDTTNNSALCSKASATPGVANIFSII